MNAPFKSARRADADAQAGFAARSTYQRGRGADSMASISAVLITCGMIGAFAFMNPHVNPKMKREPTVVTMLALPNEPPPAPAEQPPTPETPPPVAQVAAPVPLITLIERPTVIAAPAIVQPVTAPAPVAPPAPAARAPENIGDLSTRMISAKPPKFPIESRRAHEEGVVVLSVLLSTEGRVAEISVASSSGFTRLDRAALEAVREWRWSPLMRDGQAVMVRGVVTIPFILKGVRRGGGGEDRHNRPGKAADKDFDTI
ncbi:MAG TPA: energy transducer TonB [Sphingobium sp.]|nr:energy transducer TonB [Sphingobium sp.]